MPRDLQISSMDEEDSTSTESFVQPRNDDAPPRPQRPVAGGPAWWVCVNFDCESQGYSCTADDENLAKCPSCGGLMEFAGRSKGRPPEGYPRMVMPKGHSPEEGSGFGGNVSFGRVREVG